MKTASLEDRKYITEKLFGVFFIYYFHHYIKYEFADFQYDMFADVDALNRGDISETVWVEFRESIKTALAKATIVYQIVFNKSKYINADAYDKENAEGVLFDVATELQSNVRLIADFGQLYNENRSSDFKTKKRLADFITSNKIRVEAHSTQEPVRGRNYMENRPDFLLLDDFETLATVKSKAAMDQVRDHIKEFYGGLAPNAKIMYNCNYITEFGVVQELMTRAETDKKMILRFVPVADEWGGTINWPAKYVWTDAEADELNKTREKDRPIVSLEAKKRQMGDAFWAEMMNSPIDYTNAKFKREYFKIVTDMDVAKQRTALYITIDPGGREKPNVKTKRDPDQTGVCFNWVNKDNKWHIKAYGVNIASNKLIDLIFDMWDTFHPLKIGIEQGMYSIVIEPFIKDEMRRRNTYPKIEPHETKGRPKEDRIEGLQPRYANGDIFHLENEATQLEDQLLRFPKGKNDDIIDALAYQIDFCRIPDEKKALSEKEQNQNEIEEMRFPEIGI